MDERKLSELFRSAAGDAPPASFDEQDVAAASKRVTARRRAVLTGGSALVVVLLAVGFVLGSGVLRTSSGSGLSAGAASPGIARSASPFGEVPQGGANQPNFPESSSMQGGGGSGRVGQGADSTHAGCGPVDGELAVALAGEFPSAGARVAVPASLQCPPGSRTAAVAVPSGSVVAVLIPRGSTFDRAGVPAASGKWTVILISEPATAVPADQLSTVERTLAARF